MTVHSACKKLRKENFMTQDTLAKISGLSRATISGFEQGKVKSLYVAEMYLRYIGDIEVDDGMTLSRFLNLVRG